MIRFGMVWGILATGLTVGLSGCSDASGEGRVDVYPVAGKVTLGGTAPIGGATISFAPQEGQPVAIGKTGDDGKFEVTTYEWADGAAAGKYEILITKTVSSSAPATAEETHSAMAAGGGRPSHDARSKKSESEKGAMINPKYSRKGSGLTAEVTASGPNEFTFDLDP